MRPACLVLTLCLVALPNATLLAAERRCGWLHNPSPGNYWLTDRHGEWILSTQGAPATPGMERLRGITAREWVRTHGDYGYGCACVVMDAVANREVLRVHAGEPLALARCQADRSLPRP